MEIYIHLGKYNPDNINNPNILLISPIFMSPEYCKNPDSMRVFSNFLV